MDATDHDLVQNPDLDEHRRQTDDPKASQVRNVMAWTAWRTSAND